MSKERVILIAERNPHIRDLIKRELLSEGHYVFTVNNTLQLKNWMHLRRAPDILVLDPDLPGGEKQNLSELLALYTNMPVIIHSLSKVERPHPAGQRKAVFVEKNGNSITRVKHWIDFFNQSISSEEIVE